jgi:hypothetical protein
MEIDFSKVLFVQVINEYQCHINIDGIGVKLIEFDKMDINGVTYKSSDEFVTVNKLTIQENIIE